MMKKNKSAQSKISGVYIALLLLCSVVLALVAVWIPMLRNANISAPQVGQVADRDYRAPVTTSYESQILTQLRQESAVRAVQPIYTTSDTRVARQQLERLRTALAYISSVRVDAFAANTQKLEDLAAMDDIHLDQETAALILGLTDARWQTIQQEAILALEKVMSSAIRPEGVAEARNRVPALVSLSLPESQAEIVAELAMAFVAPNSEYSESLTEAAIQAATEGVAPVTRTFVAGQTVVSQGQVLSAEDVEALKYLNLAQPEVTWPDQLSAAGMVVLLGFFVFIYMRREKWLQEGDIRGLVVISFIFLVFLFGARFTIPGRTVVPYAYPLAAYGLTITALFGAKFALISTLPLAILVTFGMPNALELMLYYVIASMFGILALGRARRMAAFFGAGISIAFAGTVVMLIFRLPLPTTDAIGLATLTGASLFNGLASASLTILLQFVLAQFMGMTTPMQLVDLTRPDHPLLQSLMHEAPGTYQHSLQVANLAEQAAERIGADPLLTRVGTLYHDIGKTQNAIFFIENQLPGFTNPHLELNPYESSEIIIRHVTDGLDLARKSRLPKRIQHFISEHHGTLITNYQYVNAMNAANGDEQQVDKESFRYPGPRPQSRETAILMLADGSEARVRAEKPTNEDELRVLIQEVVKDRLEQGQLDDTRLTLKDLHTITESFTTTMRGIYHPRVKYPKLNSTTLDVPTQPRATTQAETKSDVPVNVP